MKVNDEMVNLQNILLNTMGKLSNERNLSQIQERVYLKLKKYEDEFNICHVQSRNPREAEVCAQTLMGRLRVSMVEHVDNILQEY